MHSEYFPDSFYRLSVKGLYVRDNKILMVKESDNLSGQWELPGGGLDFGEDLQEGLKREIEEEMGLSVTDISNQPIYVWTSKFEANARHIGWYYSVVVAYKIDLKDLDITISDECQEVRLFSLEELQELDIHSQSTELRKLFNYQDFIN